jgi:hypothetical protein
MTHVWGVDIGEQRETPAKSVRERERGKKKR